MQYIPSSDRAKSTELWHFIAELVDHISFPPWQDSKDLRGQVPPTVAERGMSRW
jgi:hypothetical protein